MIYHYTKGSALQSIFKDGFIATERKRQLSTTHKVTDYVWLTKSGRFPYTALPRVFDTLSDVENYLSGNVAYVVDYDKISESAGGLYRFGFRFDDKRLKQWRFSAERKQLRYNTFWQGMEAHANAVGDDIRDFYISTTDLTLNNFTLERYERGNWKLILKVIKRELNADDEQIINELSERAEDWCKIRGLSCDSFKDNSLTV